MFDIQLERGDYVQVTQEAVTAYREHEISSFSFPADLIEKYNTKFKIYDIKISDYLTFEIFLFDPDCSWRIYYVYLDKNLSLADTCGNLITVLKKVNKNSKNINEKINYLQKKFRNL